MKIKLAPAVYVDDSVSFPEYRITDELYQSEGQAKYELGPRLLKWLGGTPYEIEIEVPQGEIDAFLNELRFGVLKNNTQG